MGHNKYTLTYKTAIASGKRNKRGDYVDLLEKLAKENNLQFKKCTDLHFQIKGKLLVNIYPTRKTFYIQGVIKGQKYKNEKHLVALAKAEPGAFSHGAIPQTRTGKGRPKRKALWAKGIRCCFVCQKEFSSFEETTLEHKVPLARGGTNRMDNLALSHYECNQKRGCL